MAYFDDNGDGTRMIFALIWFAFIIWFIFILAKHLP